jgi:glycosyltransferase involved in cell wall biosynthesis
MFDGMRVVVVVPAYNEEKLIARTIRTAPDLVDHIVVVDDCSIDQTAKAALETGDPRLVLMRHVKNTGVGGAICSGHKEALRLGCDVSVVMAGDAQMDRRRPVLHGDDLPIYRS